MVSVAAEPAWAEGFMVPGTAVTVGPAPADQTAERAIARYRTVCGPVVDAVTQGHEPRRGHSHAEIASFCVPNGHRVDDFTIQ